MPKLLYSHKLPHKIILNYQKGRLLSSDSTRFRHWQDKLPSERAAPNVSPTCLICCRFKKRCRKFYLFFSGPPPCLNPREMVAAKNCTCQMTVFVGITKTVAFSYPEHPCVGRAHGLIRNLFRACLSLFYSKHLQQFLFPFQAIQFLKNSKKSKADNSRGRDEEQD